MEPSPRPGLFFDDNHRGTAVPQNLTCAPVKLALKFYHDQVVYLPADMTYGSKIEIPRSCPIVHPPHHGVTREVAEEQERADRALRDAMFRNGLGQLQERQVEEHAATRDQCSNRSKEDEHCPEELEEHKQQEYPSNMYAHVQSVKAYQARDRRYMKPNVKYIAVDFGCGGPFSAECLTGWDGIKLLTHRLHLWSDITTHLKPCNDQCLRGWSGADLDTYRQQT